MHGDTTSSHFNTTSSHFTTTPPLSSSNDMHILYFYLLILLHLKTKQTNPNILHSSYSLLSGIHRFTLSPFLPTHSAINAPPSQALTTGPPPYFCSFCCCVLCCYISTVARLLLLLCFSYYAFCCCVFLLLRCCCAFLLLHYCVHSVFCCCIAAVHSMFCCCVSPCSVAAAAFCCASFSLQSRQRSHRRRSFLAGFETFFALGMSLSTL